MLSEKNYADTPEGQRQREKKRGEIVPPDLHPFLTEAESDLLDALVLLESKPIRAVAVPWLVLATLLNDAAEMRKFDSEDWDCV